MIYYKIYQNRRNNYRYYWSDKIKSVNVNIVSKRLLSALFKRLVKPCSFCKTCCWECFICCTNSFMYCDLLAKLSRLLCGSVKSSNQTAKCSSVCVNFEEKSSGGTASGKCICIWWAKGILTVKFMFMSTLSADWHEVKDSCKSYSLLVDDHTIVRIYW